VDGAVRVLGDMVLVRDQDNRVAALPIRPTLMVFIRRTPTGDQTEVAVLAKDA
jgi:hypothetical protein